jgi:hypothetical protein
MSRQRQSHPCRKALINCHIIPTISVPAPKIVTPRARYAAGAISSSITHPDAMLTVTPERYSVVKTLLTIKAAKGWRYHRRSQPKAHPI